MSLTPAEQKTYVKKMKEMVSEMAVTFPYFAEEMSARSSLFEQLWRMNAPTAFGNADALPSDSYLYSHAIDSARMARDYYTDISRARVANMTVAQKSELVEKYRQSLYWAAASAGAAHHIRNNDLRKMVLSEVSKKTARDVIRAESKIKTIADESEYAEVRKQFLNKGLEGKLSIIETQFPPNSLIQYGRTLSSSNIPANRPAETSAAPATTSAPPATQPAAPPAAQPEADKPAAATTNEPEMPLPVPVPPGKFDPNAPAVPLANSYRCMYAGFIIPNDPCIAPSELPWKLDGLGEDFACGGGTVMCNPFMFGFKSASCGWVDAIEKGRTDKCWAEAKPYCVKPGLYATKSCTDLSNNDDSLQAAVELIRRNETAFNELGNSFQDLCKLERINFNSYPRKRTAQNIERSKADIKRTCKVAEGRMDEIAKRYGITKGPDVAPTLKGKELLQVKKPAPALTGKDLLMWKPPKKNEGSK
ncbi:hypothetical protein [Bdellovibrio sp. HCB337]|uniref:hypothetical protein n=1 Tax=Bdellovibrio sp. HCB337 TaxID=3394358 RepID=UPI0039A5B894